jgi:hypothetical protein
VSRLKCNAKENALFSDKGKQKGQQDIGYPVKKSGEEGGISVRLSKSL